MFYTYMLTEACQIMSYHWVTHSSTGKVERMSGVGIGKNRQQRVLVPGSNCQYGSCISFLADHCVMDGYFLMRYIHRGMCYSGTSE